MRLLIDMNLTPRWVHFLNGAGHQAVHWSAGRFCLEPKDSEVCTYAYEHGSS